MNHKGTQPLKTDRLEFRPFTFAGVKFSACKACADQLGISDKLANLGIEVLYWGDGLTDILKNGEKLITI